MFIQIHFQYKLNYITSQVPELIDTLLTVELAVRSPSESIE